jgi:hypothetical protein
MVMALGRLEWGGDLGIRLNGPVLVSRTVQGESFGMDLLKRSRGSYGRVLGDETPNLPAIVLR